MRHVGGIFYIAYKRCALQDMLITFFWWHSIGEKFFIVIVVDPLPYVSQHIIQSPCIWFFTFNRDRCFFIKIGRRFNIFPWDIFFRSGSGCVLPFSFGGKAVTFV